MNEGAVPHNRSSEELAMRTLLDPVLRRRWPAARIVHELPLRYSTNRIDMAAITETEIVAVEIKSSRDTMTRLAAQIAGFLPISGRIIVALAPKWNVDLPMKWNDARTIGSSQFTEAQSIIREAGQHKVWTWTVCHETGAVSEFDGWHHHMEIPWSVRLLDILWVQELQRVVVAHAVPVSAASRHDWLVRACCEHMTGRQVARAVCRELRRRPFPWADAPIDPVRAPVRLFDEAGA